MTARYRQSSTALAGLPAEARESLPAAAEIAARAGDDAGAALLVAAQQAFLDGLGVTLVVAAAVTAAIALAALAFMPRDRGLGAAPAAAGLSGEPRPTRSEPGPTRSVDGSPPRVFRDDRTVPLC
jgi:DHA2 family multidrug resistance protein-like MFS transporter